MACEHARRDDGGTTSYSAVGSKHNGIQAPWRDAVILPSVCFAHQNTSHISFRAPWRSRHSHHQWSMESSTGQLGRD